MTGRWSFWLARLALRAERYALRRTPTPHDYFAELRSRLAHSAQCTARDAERTALSAQLPAAAVAVILAPDPLSVLLIRRAERQGDPWSGHVALPGGRAEPEDADLVATAIRETAEEVGILLGRPQLLGALDDVMPRSKMPRPFSVRPFVFGIGPPPELRLSGEVASAHWEPMETLMRAETRGELALTIADVTRRFPSYQTAAGTLWGMTERVLDGLLGALSAKR